MNSCSHHLEDTTSTEEVMQMQLSARILNHILPFLWKYPFIAQWKCPIIERCALRFQLVFPRLKQMSQRQKGYKSSNRMQCFKCEVQLKIDFSEESVDEEK